MLGNGNNDSVEKTFINLKLVATPWVTDVQPKFVVLWNDFKETGETYSQVEGKLIKIKGSFTPAKGKMGDIYGFKAFIEDIEDGDEMYVIESTITNASKDLLNSIVDNVGKHLKVNLYLNKNGYPTSSVKTPDGEWAKTKFEFNAIDIPSLYNSIQDAEKNVHTTDVNDISMTKEELDRKDSISIEDVPF